MAGGGAGGAPTQPASAAQDTSRPGGMAMTPTGGASAAYLQNVYAAKQASGDIGRGQSGGQFAPPGYADGGMVQNPYNNFASPTNQGFMSYQGQGQPNQPNQPPPTLSNALPATQFMGGPDNGADYAPANMGFDGSGSDGGVGGQPAPMATPLSQGNKPLGLAQFQQPQGLQIQGNPTSQVVQRPQQR